MKSTPESRIREIAIADIDRSANHRLPRIGDAERLEAIKQSIAACGQLQAIRVYERADGQKSKKQKPYILGFGARRCAAMEALERTTIQAVVFPPATDAEIAQARAVENLHRQDITPLEEVQAVADVLEAIKADTAFTGDPYEEAAARLGCDSTWVKDRDYLHRLSKPVQRFALRSGLPAGHLRELAKLGDPAEQMRLACESIGAPPHAFAASAKDAKVPDWQERLQEEFLTHLADGKVHRWALGQLKEHVARVQLSLRQIPWDFDQPISFGATKLRKCSGCPHNSETDRTLFGIDEDAANPNGFCLNPSCYNAKHAAVDAAKEQVLRKVSSKDDQTPSAIRKLAPAWLKENTVVGYIQRQLEKAHKEAANAAESSPKPGHGRVPTELERALEAYGQAFSAWQEKAFKAILKGVNSDPAYRLSWCVLMGVSSIWTHPRVHIPRITAYRLNPVTEEPILPPLPPVVENSIRIAFKGDRGAWLAMMKEEEQFGFGHYGVPDTPHPRVLEVLAEMMELKLTPMPAWKSPATEGAKAKPVEAKA